MKINGKTAAERLLLADDILLICHRDPDGDTQGSAVALCEALRQLGKRAAVYCTSPFIAELSFLTPPVPYETFTPKFVATVDVAAVSMLGDGIERERHIDLCIDHHTSNGLYADETFLTDYAATGEAVIEIIKEIRATITPFIATALLTALSSDTGSFRYSNTTSQTLRYAAELFDAGADTAAVRVSLFESDSRAKVAVESTVMSNIKYYADGNIAVISVPLELLETHGAKEDQLEGLSSRPITIEGVLIGITLKEKGDGFTRISVRTSAPVNANDICAAFNGGGHNRASGCRIKCTLSEAEERIVAEAIKHIS